MYWSHVFPISCMQEHGCYETEIFSTKFPVFQKTSGNIIFELTSSATDISGVHYVQVSLWNVLSLDFFLLYRP